MDPLCLAPPRCASKTEIYFQFSPEICLSLSKRGALLVDAHIAQTHGATIQKALGYELISIPSGEIHKTRELKEQLENELLKRQMGRDALIVGMGGGVTTDLVGFLASTYLRGVPLVLIPTTLLGMVDAAIGGKTGVDTPFGKNTIGSFYLPKAVFIESRFLKTLPKQELKNGLSEILKYGLIQDEALWNRCRHWEKDLESLIHASIRCKIHIVEQDFEEKGGLRRTLNFGHTVGHALELLSHFQMPHGEAVALGSMAESYLSHLLGYLSLDSLETILQFYRKLGYAFQKFDPIALLEAMKRDKKSQNGEPRFVLIDRIGHCVPFNGEYCTAVKPSMLQKMIEWMEHG